MVQNCQFFSVAGAPPKRDFIARPITTDTQIGRRIHLADADTWAFYVCRLFHAGATRYFVADIEARFDSFNR